MACNQHSGQRAHRTSGVGTLEQYPTQELAKEAVNGLRMQINQTRNRQREQSIFVGDLIHHYIRTELDELRNWRSHATCTVYREFLTRWIKPHLGRTNIRDVRTVAPERVVLRQYWIGRCFAKFHHAARRS